MRTTRLFGDYKHIAIEGPIGVGKTSLARTLAQRLGGRLVLEAADTNPFLENFYSDRRRYALATQLSFLASRYRQQTEMRQHDLFEPLIISDYIFDKDRIFAGLTLSDDELDLYEQFYRMMAARAAEPDLVVLLLADVDTLLRRIADRGIPCESGLDREYIEDLSAAYGEYFRVYDDAPLLLVDTSPIDYREQTLELEGLLTEMEQTRTGQRVYVANGEAR